MKKFRVVLLTHRDFIPPDDIQGLPEKEVDRIRTEYDVFAALDHLDHDIHKLGLHDDLKPLRETLESWKPHIVFNLLEEFRDQAALDQNVVSYLELMRTPYTGNGPRGLLIARDKALTKKILHYHRIRTPGFCVFPPGRRVQRPRPLTFPLIVKSLTEDASAGIAQASVVTSDEKLTERVEFIHETVGTAAIAEQYIEGRELYVSILGNRRLQVLPLYELRFTKLPPDSYRIATQKSKWDFGYQKQHGISLGVARGLKEDLVKNLQRISKRIYRHLELSGYSRLDFRLSENDEPYLLEANPNPDIASDGELAGAAAAGGMDYETLIQKVMNLGLSRHRDLV